MAGAESFRKLLNYSLTVRSPLDGGSRRGRRWRDQTSLEEDPLDLSSSFTGEMKPSVSDVTARSDSPRRDQVVHDQKLETPKTAALPQHGLRDQNLETSRTSTIPEREQETPKPTTLIQHGMRHQTPDITSRRALPLHKDIRSTQHPPQISVNTPSSSYPQQGQLQLTNQIQAQSTQGQPIVPSQYQSTPTYIPQGSQFMAVDKAQLEGEMHALMKRIHDMEGNAQRQQIDGAGYGAQLEAKVSSTLPPLPLHEKMAFN